MNCPLPFVLIVAHLLANPLTPDRMDIDCLDYFSGMKAVTHAFIADGQFCLPYDILEDADLCDINSNRGFCHAVLAASRLKSLGEGFASLGL